MVTIKKLLKALNRMDEFASISTQENDNNEAENLAKDYEMLFNFISKPQVIEIPFTENDLQELQSGEEFNWTYQTEAGQDIQVRLYNEDL